MALSPKPRTPSGERRGRREGRDFPQRDPPPISPTETTQCPEPEPLTRDRSVDDVKGEDGGPNARGPGAREAQEGGPADSAGMLPLRAPQLCRRTRPSSRRPSPTRPYLTRRDGYSTRPGTHQPRALGPAGPAASSPPFSSTLLGLAPRANLPPCLGSAVGRGRKRGRATPSAPVSQLASAASPGPAPCAASAGRRPAPAAALLF